jgi:hypothetical protein
MKRHRETTGDHLEIFKGKSVNLSLGINTHYAIRRMGESLLTQVHESGEWSASRFIPWESALGAHCLGGWMGPRTCVDVMKKRNVFCICIERRVYDRPADGLVAIPTEATRLSPELLYETKQ